ncbi:hypothetical protein VSR01_16245 [Actinacidiphila sp. DG2A-62]|uniref:hypothetical protein n=1 Tax=Actinacidiphila sp. DG2A-62 TaxID=3108821 RepID=UPI002DB6F31E|nr:hypothetical protein [Actinacidiphila sp. DG2A-62]MEC3994996.1 hypothetical protein [Actinacidiphila sp. DG2A-62]
MPVEPLPCGPDGGTGTPGDCACAPSITSTPLCRADGSTVLVVVRSPCGTCGTAPADPVQVGWIDPTTGVYTPGAPPADAAPCETATPPCAATTCRQRCDDTTGDGTADTTYTELWCLAPDGTATLLLTYQDDPSTPYVPVSPVECTYGCPDDETVMLCDSSGPFLRRYSFLAGTATYVDVALDGQTPHVVSGTVGTCPTCDPTPPLALVGLCLAGGAPIAVVVSRQCDGTTTRDGWLDLATGIYSTGAPPAGTGACSPPGAFELAGILCDTDPATGNVLGLALVQYAYSADGTLASVSLINPGDGTTYHLQGELRTCPTGQAVPDADLVVLCDVLPDGTVNQFVRDFRRDENTLIVGHTDYLLDGAGYHPTGTVRLCPAEPDCPAQTVEVVCKCDDTDADGSPETPYVELVGVSCDGTLTALGTYLPDFSAPYVPVSPLPCDAGEDLGAPAVFGVQAGRVVLAPGQSWDGATVPTLQAVTVAASGGSGTITTQDGPSPLTDGQTAAWTVARDVHARLTGPLVITAVDGTVTVTYTKEITL